MGTSAQGAMEGMRVCVGKAGEDDAGQANVSRTWRS